MGAGKDGEGENGGVGGGEVVAGAVGLAAKMIKAMATIWTVVLIFPALRAGSGEIL